MTSKINNNRKLQDCKICSFLHYAEHFICDIGVDNKDTGIKEYDFKSLLCPVSAFLLRFVLDTVFNIFNYFVSQDKQGLKTSSCNWRMHMLKCDMSKWLTDELP